eukprot:TRINITY_DN6538_c0_g1_i2.p1 TRINITY_DN6538_c0_g1~~TRINITY_DN6538_c0_g1_i2.p1  ORF type:complete len:363 (+),score=52.53 TRINITY_DN6538_c0_g1_i2:434-1522(+)
MMRLMSTSDDTLHQSSFATQMANRRVQREHGPDLGRSQEVHFPPLVKTTATTPTSLSDMSWAIPYFEEQLRSEDTAVAVAAITVLTEAIKRSHAHTMYEVQLELNEAAKQMRKCSSSISLSSGCDLFTNFVTRTVENISDFELCKKRLIERGENFKAKAVLARSKIGINANRFMNDGVVILTHGFSRVVLAVLLRALESNKNFSVVVAESRPDSVGYLTAKALHDAGVPVTLTTDNALAHIMDTVDMVLVGAEAVVESGGIVSRIGTYGLSIVAKALKKPFYVAAESFKFTRLYPLNQRDIPVEKRQKELVPAADVIPMSRQIKVDNPPVDYTPPEYITLLFTDLGVLTPSAISDELIKLYY